MSRESVSPPLSSSPQKQKQKRAKQKKWDQQKLLRNSVSKKWTPVIAPAALGGSGDVACGHHGAPSRRKGGGNRQK